MQPGKARRGKSGVLYRGRRPVAELLGYEAVQRAAGSCRPDEMRYHEPRHGAVSPMAAHGIPARTAIEIVGYAQNSTTMNFQVPSPPTFKGEQQTASGTRCGLERLLVAVNSTDFQVGITPQTCNPPIAQRIEHWFPKPCAQVRVLLGGPSIHRFGDHRRDLHNCCELPVC